MLDRGKAGIQASDMVARDGKTPTDDLTEAEPRIQLDAKHRRNTSILTLQTASVLPQKLRTINLFPERLVTTGKASESGVEEVLGEVLALVNGGRVDDVVFVLLHERLVVRASVLGHDPRRLARLGLPLRQL